jgi:16S rRNA (cytosine1402-N4)-methyltransferase
MDETPSESPSESSGEQREIQPDRPPRRQRYAGKNPRNFSEKYKELRSEEYPAEMLKVVSNGRTPAGTHRPIMVDEIMLALRLVPGSIVADCTLAYGGHSTVMLQAIQPNGRLIAMDHDPFELAKTEKRLRSYGYPEESLVIRRMNFAGAAQLIAAESPGGVDAILVDLGVSSMQLDDPDRGFSYKLDGPLDMRMNQMRGRSASQLLSTWSEIQLATILTNNADEPNAKLIAAAIVLAHSKQPLVTTFALAAVVRCVQHLESTGGYESAIRRVFQAIRIEVNQEFESLDTFLAQLPSCLRPGGRVAILSFHSGEDRRVKLCFKQGLQQGVFTSISNEFQVPTHGEVWNNSRARSAKLRVAVRL